MADAFSLPIAEIAVLFGAGKLKARALAEEAIANHERFGPKLMVYSQWAPEHARKCAEAADAAFAVGSRAGSLQGIPTSIKDLFAVAGFPTYAGSPATLPVGLDCLGMPVGLQLIARGGDDERLVAIACAAERVLGTPRENLGAPPMCKG